MKKPITTYEKCATIRNALLIRAAEVMTYTSLAGDFAVDRIQRFPSEMKEAHEELLDIPGDLTEAEMESLGFRRWGDSDFLLIPLWLFPFLAENIMAVSISGEVVDQKSKMDTDHRFGCLAYGVYPKVEK